MPSTGKLYHHKMKLRMLTGESDVEEMLAYLEKRHPLYFMQRKLSKEQIRDLIKRLKFRVGQMQKNKPGASTLGTGSVNTMDSKKGKPSLTATAGSAAVTNKENVGQSKVTFKSGS